jgi:hypothetical protein
MNASVELDRALYDLFTQFRQKFSSATTDTERESALGWMKELHTLGHKKLFKLRIAEELKEEKKCKRLAVEIRLRLQDISQNLQ